MGSMSEKLNYRSILHLNVADFAVAVERLCEPGLKGRPLIDRKSVV
jgi:hypothetical protein